MREEGGVPGMGAGSLQGQEQEQRASFWRRRAELLQRRLEEDSMMWQQENERQNKVVDELLAWLGQAGPRSGRSAGF